MHYSKTLAGVFMAVVAITHLSGCQSTPLPDNCYEKPESGRCRAAIERYYYDQQWQECRPFIWGGCGGGVPFETMESCQSMCPSLTSDGMVGEPADPPLMSPKTQVRRN